MPFQGNYIEAANNLRQCLRALGRPLPVSKFDQMSCFVWHFIRQSLHRIHIGKWLSSKAGGFWAHVSSDEVYGSAKDAALVYHKLHQLHITGMFYVYT